MLIRLVCFCRWRLQSRQWWSGKVRKQKQLKKLIHIEISLTLNLLSFRAVFKRITATDLDHFLPLDLSDRGELSSLRNQLPILLSDGALLKTREHRMGQWFSTKQNVNTYCAYIKLFEVQLKEIKYNWPKLPEV